MNSVRGMMMPLIVCDAFVYFLGSPMTTPCSVPSGDLVILYMSGAVRVAKFVRNFMKEQAGETAILDAFKAYHAAVQDGSFPAREQTFQVEL